jgi:hypothetical protein
MTNSQPTVECGGSTPLSQAQPQLIRPVVIPREARNLLSLASPKSQIAAPLLTFAFVAAGL